MKQVAWMTAGCVGSGVLAALVIRRPVELLFGMLGPLVATSATWLAVTRAQRRNPAGLTSLLVGAFAAKLVFFAAYVVVVNRLWPMDLTVFGAAFTVYFMALYVVQAVLMRGLAPAQAS
jgi:hypothetical protein